MRKIVSIAICIVLCVTMMIVPANAAVPPDGLLPVVAYDSSFNYMKYMIEAIEDGSDFAIAYAKICETARNKKIADNNMIYGQSNIFTTNDINTIRENLRYYLDNHNGNNTTEETETFLLEASVVDKTYTGQKVVLSDYERQVLAEVIMNEFGADYIGSCLIAQCIRDAMLMNDYSVLEVIKEYQYIYRKPNPTQYCYDAINYVFDEGKSVVQHRILFMYNPSMCSSAWHESQEFIVYYGGVRFFDLW